MRLYRYIVLGIWAALFALTVISGCTRKPAPVQAAAPTSVSASRHAEVAAQNVGAEPEDAGEAARTLDPAVLRGMATDAMTRSAVAWFPYVAAVAEPEPAQVLYLMRAARYREAADAATRAPQALNMRFIAAKARVLANLCTAQSPCAPAFDGLAAPIPELERVFAYWHARAVIADGRIDDACGVIREFEAKHADRGDTRRLVLALDAAADRQQWYGASRDPELLTSLRSLAGRVLQGTNSFEAATLIHLQMKIEAALGNADQADAKKQTLILQYPATQMSLWPELATSQFVAEHYSYGARNSRVKELIDHFDYDNARVEIHSLLEDPNTPEGIRNSLEWELARISLSNAADPATSEKIYRKWAQKSGARREEAVFGIARSLSRQSRFREAIDALEDYERQYPRGKFRTRSLYLRGWYEFELRNNDAARPLLKQYAEKTNDTSVWGFYAQTFIRDERWQEAIDAFRHLLDNGNPIVRGKALYWQAYAAHRLSDDAQARARLDDIHREFPLTWYDILAMQRAEDWFGENADEAVLRAFRRESDPPVDTVFYPWGNGAPILHFPDSEIWNTIATLADFDAISDAKALYRGHESAILAGVPADERSEFRRYATHLVEYYYTAWDQVSGSVRGLSGVYPSRANPRHKMGYPQPFGPLVRSLADEYGLPPYFIYGIMLQESRFRPWQISSADAIGALQMIPKTARPIAKALGLEFHPDTFFDPRVGFPYSAYYMKMHYEKWGHNLAFTAGSYNGGPHRIGPWALRDQGKTIDFVVDEFSYDESRHYARKVVEHTLRFAYLYARSAEEWLDVVHKLVPRHVPEIAPTDDWGL